MFAKTFGAGILGLNGVLFNIEVDISNGIPGMEIVGLPDAAVRESKERVRAAIRNSGYEVPCRRITVNLAPADQKKDGSGLDLPIAIGILAASEQIAAIALDEAVLVGELSLDAKLRGINGVLPMAIMCRQIGIKRIVLPVENAVEAKVVDAIKIAAVDSLQGAIAAITGDLPELSEPATFNSTRFAKPSLQQSDDFCDVQGQLAAKRALEIAAAGGHNVLMTGSPGAGKTMLARRIASILPPMTQDEALEVSKIYSVAGLLGPVAGLVEQRPFRSPHHTVSAAAMAGGGRIPRPGEVTLAHNGVLFLDELTEFPRQVLEVLRQPVEDGQVTVARVNSTYTYPSRFMLILAMNPCPCGYFGDSLRECCCSQAEIKRYLRRISGPLMDRIDLHINVPRLRYEEMATEQQAEPSKTIAGRVAAARACQAARFAGTGVFCNAQMNHRQIKDRCQISKDAQELLRQAFEKMNLNARSYDRIIKVAQTIADLAGQNRIDYEHMAEAVQLRLTVADSSHSN
jgi:magnesium chelatase family protein